MKILFTGGGTAGHIYPIIAIAREIRKSHPGEGIEFFYIGPKDKFAAELFSQDGIKVKTVLAGKIRRYFSFQNILDVLKTPLGFIQAFYHIFVLSPDIIFSKGGYGSLPAVLAGWLLWVPIFLHESDIYPGLANQIAGRFALEIFTAFPAERVGRFPIRKIFSAGNPLRTELFKGDKKEAKKNLKIAGEKPVLFILGGSQGAQRLNDVILLVLDDILGSFEVIHQTGRENIEQVKIEAGVVIKDNVKKYYHPVSFLNDADLANAFAAADLVISRAGAGSIFEIAALGKPSILVPLPNSAQNHQLNNAYAFAEDGAAIVMEENNFTPRFLLEKLEFIFSKPSKLREMSKKAKEFSRPEAAKVIAEYLMTYLKQ